jgi:hypothetical protein
MMLWVILILNQTLIFVYFNLGAYDHGLPKVLLGPAMPYHSIPYRRPPLKQSYGHFTGSRSQGTRPAAVFPPHVECPCFN